MDELIFAHVHAVYYNVGVYRLSTNCAPSSQHDYMNQNWLYNYLPTLAYQLDFGIDLKTGPNHIVSGCPFSCIIPLGCSSSHGGSTHCTTTAWKKWSACESQGTHRHVTWPSLGDTSGLVVSWWVTSKPETWNRRKNLKTKECFWKLMVSTYNFILEWSLFSWHVHFRGVQRFKSSPFRCCLGNGFLWVDPTFRSFTAIGCWWWLWSDYCPPGN